MARVVVIGGGFGGIASAARAAKLGHDVQLVSPDLGGALTPFEADGFSWDYISTTALPAVVRDLARKSGRPLERELELEHVEIVREHRWRDGMVRRIPGGTRAAQVEELGEAWATHVGRYADVWETTRQHLFESRTTVRPESLESILTSRETLARRLRRDFRDKRLREMAAWPFIQAGHQVRDVPAWAGVNAYLDQRFGHWRPVGGMTDLREVLVRRLETRRVEHVAALARDLVVEGSRVVAVRTDRGDLTADAVIVAIDPRFLPATAPLARATLPAMPPTVVHLGLTDDVPDLPHEVVLHGDPTLVLRPGGRAPDGAVAWTVLVHGQLLEEIDLALWRHGVKFKPEQILSQHRLSPSALVTMWNGAPGGVAWRGRGTVDLRLGPTTPIEGVFAAGAASVSGDGLPFVGLSAVLAVQALDNAVAG